MDLPKHWGCEFGHTHNDDPGEDCPHRDPDNGSWCGAPVMEYVTVPARAVTAERDWCKRILYAERRSDERVYATLANAAAMRLRDLGGQDSAPPEVVEDGTIRRRRDRA